MDFKTALPSGPRQSFTKIIFINPTVFFHENGKCHRCHRRIDCLMGTDKGNKEHALFQFFRHAFPFHHYDLALLPFVSCVDFKITAVKINACFFIVGIFFQFLQSHMLRRSDYRNPLFDNSRFFSRYFLKGISQILHVIHSHIRNDGNNRHHYIGRVKTSAHADFHNGVIRFVFTEIPKRDGCQQFKFRQCFFPRGYQLVMSFKNHCGRFGKIFPGDIFPAQVNPFRVIYKMR